MERNEHENEELLREIVTAFTKHPEDIEIWSKQIPGTRSIETLTLRVNADDQPVVVGGEGRQIQSIRTIFKFIGARDDRTIRLLLLEPEKGVQQEYGHAITEPYQPEAITGLARKILERILAAPFNVEIYGEEETTMLEIETAPDELRLAEGLTPYLKSVFNAVGHYQGRDLHLEVRAMIEIPK